MNPRNKNKPKDFASFWMASTFLANLIAVDEPEKMARHLSEQLRELTGAQTIILFQHTKGPFPCRLLYVCPPRRSDLFTGSELSILCPICNPEPVPLNTADLPEGHPLRDPLKNAGVTSLLSFPLYAGGQQAGSIVLLNLPTPEWSDEISSMIEFLGPLIGLTIQNCFALQKIREQKEKLQLTQFALDHSADAAFWMDQTGRFTYINEAACRSLGYSREELLQLSLKDIDPDFPAEIWSQHWQDMKEKRSLTYESHHKTKNDHVFPVEIHANYICFGDEEYNCTFVQDITERKQVEEELRKLTTAVQQSPSVIAITDLKGNLEYVNPKFTELTGYTSAEVIGQNPRILKSGKLPDEMYKELWDIISSGKEWHGEFHNKKKNGEFFWEAASISPIFDKQGKMINYIKVAEDITERKRAEEALRESEEKYRTIFESSPEAIILFDKKGNVIDINDRIEDWLGYKSGDMVRKNLAVFPFMSNRSKALALKKIYQRMSGEEIPPFELEFTDKNGEKRIGLTTASIIKDEKGEIIQNLVMISDITERKKAEEELTKHREHLEELVKERTKELEEKNNELKRYNKLFEGREFRIKELKDKVKELEVEVRSKK